VPKIADSRAKGQPLRRRNSA